MKQFFKFMLASMLGFFLTSVIVFFIFLTVILSVIAFSTDDKVKVKENSVLHLTFDGQVVDRRGTSPFDDFDFLTGRPVSSIGLYEFLRNIEKAKNDKNISGIFLDLTHIDAGLASIDEIRQSLIDFKESEKFIVAYSETFTQSAYYLGSVADEVYLNPEGMINFIGLNAQLFFIKNMLEKVGIKPQLIRYGEYKSAGEPFFLDKMSAENREQTSAYVNSIWNHMLKGISESRTLTLNHLNNVADNFLTRNAGLALENGMIDGIMFYDEVMDDLRSRLGLDENGDISFINYSRYLKAPSAESSKFFSSKENIAVIYGMGMIISGDAGEQYIASDRIAKAVSRARLDESVKAIVFRINSGGGSALASDVILREVKLAAKEKPFIVSMGDVAASGGYYIASAADMIIAGPNTITGSIGVIYMVPNMQEFFNEKLGITFDIVKTNELSDFTSVDRPLTRREEQILQEYVDDIYTTFIGHVAEGRNLPVETVDKLGGGRVWSGVDAKRIGLIDEFGGLQYSIKKAAEMAELDEYNIVEYPERKEFIVQLLEEFGGIQDRWLEKRIGDKYKYFKILNEVENYSGAQAIMPYNIILE